MVCPGSQTFVDSRVDIFEYAGVLRDYLDAIGLKQPLEVLEKYNVRSVLLPSDEALVYFLEHDPAWKEIYRDKVCVLLERTAIVPASTAANVTLNP